MKKFLIIIMTLLVSVLAIGFVACDKKDKGSNATSDSSGKNDSAAVKVVDNKVDSDATVLKRNGYNVYSEYAKSAVKAYASSIGANETDLVCVTTATKLASDDTINIYYFKTEDAAKACYDAYWTEDSYYHIKEGRIFYDNTQANIFKYDDLE